MAKKFLMDLANSRENHAQLNYLRADNKKMTNHPNRSRAKIPASNPTPDQIIHCRTNSGLTQTQAAAVIYCGLRAWQQWEAGYRRMHPAFFELFLKKTGQIDIDHYSQHCHFSKNSR